MLMTTRLTWTFLFLSLLGIIFYAFSLTRVYPWTSYAYAANQNYGSGYYINLSGAGADMNGNIGSYNDEADCQQSNGVCNAKNRNTGQNYANGRVDKYICNEKTANCDNSHSSNVISTNSGYSQSISGASCGQTVQLDVWDGNALHGYMTWYAGDCAYGGAASPPPGTVTVTTCNNRIISQSTLENELRGAGYPGPWGDINTELAAFNRAACPQGGPQPSPVSASPVPTPSPQIITNTVYVYPSPAPTQVVRIITAAAQPSSSPRERVVYTQPKSLPSTGNEAATLLLTGGPIGFLLKKIAQKLSQDYII